MNSLKKKKLLNLIMVVAIVAIIAAGVLSVGSLQGWFDKPENKQLVFVSSDKLGSVSIERAGISYSLRNGVHIRDGDRIETLNASSVTLSLGEMNCVKLGENTQTNIILQTRRSSGSSADSTGENKQANISLQEYAVFDLIQGEAFVDMSAEGGFCVLRLDRNDVDCKNGVFYFSSQTGTKTICVLSGTAEANGKTATAGQLITLLASDSGLTTLVSDLSPQWLNAFAISCIKTANEHATLCFTNSELDAITVAREKEQQQAQQALIAAAEIKASDPAVTVDGETNNDNSTVDADNDKTGTESSTIYSSTAISDNKADAVDKDSRTDAGTDNDGTGDTYEPRPTATPTPGITSSLNPTSTPKPTVTPKPTSVSKPTSSPKPTVTPKPTSVSKPTSTPKATPKPTPTPVPAPDAPKYCTIEIRCDTILDHMDWLAAGKSAYVPANGIILAKSRIQFAERETVFDVLKRACSLTGIQLEYSWTPMYGSYYIEGINNLYEFDCGEPGNNQSGWMYKVNGWFPNYGCSSYKLKDGDVIVWCYTCRDLGEDVGCYWMG